MTHFRFITVALVATFFLTTGSVTATNQQTIKPPITIVTDNAGRSWPTESLVNILVGGAGCLSNVAAARRDIQGGELQNITSVRRLFLGLYQSGETTGPMEKGKPTSFARMYNSALIRSIRSH
ncbi:MAG: hypothetical protein IPH31_10665 [Lewinellaceae bacterium]|nr:hypothetical protein [Lewinellaceae bacterium]